MQISRCEIYKVMETCGEIVQFTLSAQFTLRNSISYVVY